MSEVKHAFRLMLIDINADKVLVDEFCDAVVAGTAENPEEGKIQDRGNVIVACRCSPTTGIAAAVLRRTLLRSRKRIRLQVF